MAEPYATPSEARTFYAGEDAGGVTLSVYMTTAATLVQKYAPVPDPEPADYAEQARNAELLVGAYLADTGGYLSGDSIAGISGSYDHNAIWKIVRGAMGDYASGATGRMRIRRIERT